MSSRNQSVLDNEKTKTMSLKQQEHAEFYALYSNKNNGGSTSTFTKPPQVKTKPPTVKFENPKT